MKLLSAPAATALTVGVVGAGLVSIALALPLPTVPSTAPTAPPATGMSGTLQTQLNGLAASVLGPNRAIVSANVAVDPSHTRRRTLTYGKRATTLSSSVASTSGTGLRQRRASSAFGHDEQVTTTTIAPGRVKRIELAVIVDAAVPSRTVTALQRELATAAGLQRSRGDRLSLTRTRFAAGRPSPSSPLASARVRPLLGYGRWGLLGAGVLACACLSALARRRTS
jgi:flagellar biosynthesis/type III secretory pathway M-ring protein FliF/YscJ